MNLGKQRVVVPVSIVLLASTCGTSLAQASDPDAEVGAPVAATTDRGFDAAVKSTLDCLASKDWKGFRKFACPTVMFVLAVRMTPSMISPAQRVYLQHGATHALDPTVNSGVTLESLLEVDSRKPLSLSDKPAFIQFCDGVIGSVDERKSRVSRIRKGMNLHAGDDFIMVGPAVQCHVMSNVNWRIEFQRTHDGWRVSRLIVTTH